MPTGTVLRSVVGAASAAPSSRSKNSVKPRASAGRRSSSLRLSKYDALEVPALRDVHAWKCWFFGIRNVILFSGERNISEPIKNIHEIEAPKDRRMSKQLEVRSKPNDPWITQVWVEINQTVFVGSSPGVGHLDCLDAFSCFQILQP